MTKYIVFASILMYTVPAWALQVLYTAEGDTLNATNKLISDNSWDGVFSSTNVTVSTSNPKFGERAFNFKHPDGSAELDTIVLPGSKAIGARFTLAAYVDSASLAKQRLFSSYPGVIQRCRHHGIAPWISIRMNDVHYNDNLDHPFHSPFWRKPELFRDGHPGYFARALDYAHAEVRDHYLALITETLERYDIAGLELDFMREPYLFSMGREPEGRQILTGWLREIRTLAKAAAKRRGHAVMLGVRVPSSPDTITFTVYRVEVAVRPE